jgi:CO/xanthine dehydrogenase Mo-binding subunit
MTRRLSSRVLNRGAFRVEYEPAHPFGVKAVAIPLDGAAPAVANAVYDALGVQVPVIPLTPERVWRALQERPATESR